MEFVGELDVHAAGEIEGELGLVAGLSERDGRAAHGRELVLDLSGVSFIDSAGLRLLERLDDAVTARGGRVWLHDPSRVVLRLLEVLRIDQFDMCRSVTGRRSSGSHPVRMGDRIVRLVELAGSREHRRRRRLTIDACTSTTRARRTGGWRRDLLYAVHGELDASAVSLIDERCGCRADGVVVDLSGVTLIDSAGARVVERLAAAAVLAGARFAVRDPSPIVQRVFDVLHVSVNVVTPARIAREESAR